METIYNTGTFTTLEIVEINIFYHWKKVHSIGDLVLCDSLTIKLTMTTRQEGSSSREFPLQQPSCSAFKLQKQAAIGSITISGLKL